MAKIISIIAIVTLATAGFWVSAEPWVNSGVKFTDVHIWLWPLILLIVASALIAVAYMVLPQKRLKMLVAGIVGLSYVVIFGFEYLNAVAFFLILIFHVIAIRYIQLESQERLKIHAGLVIHRGINWVMLPLLMALSFAYFLSPAIQVRAHDPLFSPGLKVAVNEVMEKFLAADSNIPADQKEQVKNYAIDQAYGQLTSAVDPYRHYFPPVLAFGLFLILWGLGFILYRLSMLVGMGIFLILRETNFIHIDKKQIDAETINLWPQITTKP